MITFAYTLLKPALGENMVFMAVVMLGVLWVLTFFNFGRMKHSTTLSTVGTVVGALIPITILVVLTFAWLAQGNVSNMGDLTLSTRTRYELQHADLRGQPGTDVRRYGDGRISRT
jgi:amino acid transporter